MIGLWRPPRLLAAVLLVVLAGCGPATIQPTPRPAPLPVIPSPTTRRPGPAPTVVEQGAGLPGRLLFVKDGDLWLWQGDGGRQLTELGDAFQPAWSPDGERIAFIRRGESYSDLVVMPASGRAPLALTSNGSNSTPHSYERIYDSMWAFYPAWSPDGNEIAFVSQGGPPTGSPAADYHLALFVTPAGAGGGRTQLYADDGGHVGRLAYAPDGKQIVFAYAPVGPDATQLYRYTQATGSAGTLGAPAQSYDPAFSPDGRWLAFAGRNGGGTDLFLMPVGGGTPARLTNLGSARAPAFAPDGKLLAFLAITPGAHAFDLWVVALETGADGAPRAGQPRQITHDMALDADSGVAWAR